MTGMIFVQYFKSQTYAEAQKTGTLGARKNLIRDQIYGQFMVQRWDREKLSLSKLFIVDGGELPDFSFPLNATVSYMSYFHHFYRHV